MYIGAMLKGDLHKKLFHVCEPDTDPDTWHEQRGLDHEDAAQEFARAKCDADAGCYRSFTDGVNVLVRADGESERVSFEVTVESVPHFSAREKRRCG